MIASRPELKFSSGVPVPGGSVDAAMMFDWSKGFTGSSLYCVFVTSATVWDPHARGLTQMNQLMIKPLEVRVVSAAKFPSKPESVSKAFEGTTAPSAKNGLKMGTPKADKLVWPVAPALFSADRKV